MTRSQKRPLGNGLLVAGIVLVAAGVPAILWGYIQAVGGIEAGALEEADPGMLLLGAIVGFVGLALLTAAFAVRYRNHSNMGVA